ncbi:hypothetical protein [Solimicrobium silvestre]|uniref:hypothetical protein n=1 Tax=Solimicrobium silvestre TaxID=2099400 RepID=UPI0010570D8F|nr:hypothetical protein [Solimicrobium silvestre]
MFELVLIVVLAKIYQFETFLLFLKINNNKILKRVTNGAHYFLRSCFTGSVSASKRRWVFINIPATKIIVGNSKKMELYKGSSALLTMLTHTQEIGIAIIKNNAISCVKMDIGHSITARALARRMALIFSVVTSMEFADSI